MDSAAVVLNGIAEIAKNHYPVLLFILMIFLARYFVRKAVSTLGVGAFEVKQIKPADNNFTTLLFSILLPFFKIPFTSLSDLVFLFGFLVTSILYAIVVNSSYHFNLVFRLVLGYKNYEVQSKKEVTYLVLSKEILIQPRQFTRYVTLTNHMLINVT